VTKSLHTKLPIPPHTCQINYSYGWARWCERIHDGKVPGFVQQVEPQ